MGGMGSMGGKVDEYSAESGLSVAFAVLWFAACPVPRPFQSNRQVRYGKIIPRYLSAATSFAPRPKRNESSIRPRLSWCGPVEIEYLKLTN